MKRTYRFIEPSGTVTCHTAAGEHLELPIFAGILKHPRDDQLADLLTDPVVARKYTCEALRKAPWSALRRFPRAWLLACLQQASLPDGRRRALALMLGA
jgi:hypothetical protein